MSPGNPSKLSDIDTLIGQMARSPVLRASGAQILYLNPQRVESSLSFEAGGLVELVMSLTTIKEAQVKAKAEAAAGTPTFTDFLLKLRAGISASASRGNRQAELQSIKLDPQWRALLLETAWRRSGLLRDGLAEMTTPGAVGLVENTFTPFLRDRAEGGALADFVGDTAAGVMLSRLAALDKAGPPQFLLAAAEPFPAAVVLSYPGIPREAGGLVEGDRSVAFPSESDRFYLVRRLAPDRDVIFLNAYYIVERFGEEDTKA